MNVCMYVCVCGWMDRCMCVCVDGFDHICVDFYRGSRVPPDDFLRRGRYQRKRTVPIVSISTMESK